MNDKLQKTLTGFLGMATILIILVIVWVGFGIRNTIAEGAPDDSTIIMSAEGKVRAEPDTASVSFSVLTQAATAQAVQEQNDQKMRGVLDFVKDSGIEDKDIKTANYNLYPRYNYSLPERDPGRILGYDLFQQVTVTVRDLARVSSLVGGLTGAGANQIEDVSFYIDDSDELKAQAREEAVAKAREKAVALAGQLGVKLGKVISFNENSGGFSEPVPYAREAAIGFGGGAPDAPIQTGTQDITVNVTIIYEIK